MNDGLRLTAESKGPCVTADNPTTQRLLLAALGPPQRVAALPKGKDVTRGSATSKYAKPRADSLKVREEPNPVAAGGCQLHARKRTLGTTARSPIRSLRLSLGGMAGGRPSELPLGAHNGLVAPRPALALEKLGRCAVHSRRSVQSVSWRRLAALTPSASDMRPILSIEILVSARSTNPTKVRCNPARSARASWLRPRSFRTRRTFVPKIRRSR